jgi:hypothetical protein
MKHFIVFSILAVALSQTAAATPHEGFSGQVGFFYTSLSPYGQWFETSFGYAWRPLHVGHGWRPYINGQWAWTDYGWYWISNEPFGWATFHYGRWVYDDYYGWIWIPDDVWGPAWVEWRYDNDYIGWAPLPPYATFSINVGITFSQHWIAPVHYWNFVPCGHFTTTRLVDYVQAPERTRRIFGNTRTASRIDVVDHRIMNRGIDVNFLERRTNSRINRVDVVTRDQGNGDRFIRDAGRERIESYRPRLDGSTRSNTPLSPADIRSRDRSNPRGDLGRGSNRSDSPLEQHNTTITPDRSRDRAGSRSTPSARGGETQRNNQGRQDEYFDRRQGQQREEWQQQRELRSRNQQVDRERPANQRFERPSTRESQQPQSQDRQRSTQRSPESRNGRGGRR